MKRFLQALGILAVITIFAACHKDDNNVTPPRDYAVQYALEKDSIETYLKTHYITVDANYDVVIDTLDTSVDPSHTSIWDQTEYPIKHKNVTRHEVEYTIYYLKFREGVGNAPTRGDNVIVAYRGFLFDNTQFDYNPYPQTPSPLTTTATQYGTIEGWQQIIPLFSDGTAVPELPGNPNPPTYQDYGAGVMFLPSDFGYYNDYQDNIPAYSPLVFSIKLYKTVYTDVDADGILNKYENEIDPNTNEPKIDILTGKPFDIIDYDTNDDGIPNFLDPDDDGDGFSTLYEITKPNVTPTEYYLFNEIPTCTKVDENGNTIAIKKHLYDGCH